MSPKLSHQGMILAMVSLCFQLLFIIFLIVTLEQAQDTLRQSDHSRKIIAAVKQSGEIIAGSVKTVITMPDAADGAVKRYRHDLGSQLALLQNLVAGNEEESKSVSRLRELLTLTIFKFSDLQKMSLPKLKVVLVTGGAIGLSQISREVAGEIAAILKNETAKKRDLDRTEVKLQNRVQVILAAGMPISVIIAFVLMRQFNKATARRLATLLENIRRFSAKQPLLEPIRGADELAQLDKTFRLMADRLARKEAEKQRLLSMITENLHKPLTSLTLCLDSISDQPAGALPDKAAQDVQLASRSVSRLVALIEDLLDSKRLSAGKLELAKRQIAVKDVIDRSLTSVGAWAEHLEIQMEVDLDEETQCCADGDRLEQVLINLLSNALKFSPPGGRILVCGKVDQNWLQITVSDNGPGIASEKQEHIFERFEQLEDAASNKASSGLGLHICKVIITAHNGTIGVNSEVGKGSSFWFRIPKELTGET